MANRPRGARETGDMFFRSMPWIALRCHESRSLVREPLHCNAMKRHDCTSSSPRQSIQGCGTTQPRGQGSGIGDQWSLQSPDLTTMSPRQPTQGCGATAQGSGIGDQWSLQSPDLTTMSPRQPTQGCGATQPRGQGSGISGHCKALISQLCRRASLLKDAVQQPRALPTPESAKTARFSSCQ
jgi:hypothetical protein